MTNKRLTVITGFSTPERSTRRTADALREYYELDKSDVEAISFTEAMDDRLRTGEIAQDSDVIAHSAGILAVRAAGFNRLTAVASPMPTRKSALVARAALKTPRMIVGSFGDKDRLKKVSSLNMGLAADLMMHPVKNLRHLPEISKFDINSLPQGEHQIRAAYMSHDEFGYRAGAGQLELDGVHDELLLDPQGVIDQIEAKSPW